MKKLIMCDCGNIAVVKDWNGSDYCSKCEELNEKVQGINTSITINPEQVV